MKVTKKQLKSIVRGLISESRKNLREEDSITLASGEKTSFGSKEHLDDLESSLMSMKRMRDAQRRGTSSRMAYSQAVKQLQRQLRSAKRHFEKNNTDMLEEQSGPPMGLEDDSPEYQRGYQDALDGAPKDYDANDEYDAGYEDGLHDADLEAELGPPAGGYRLSKDHPRQR